MPEGANIEIAHSLTEHEDGQGTIRQEGWHRVLEILEVGLLAIVAIATAWSGFQAAKWDGRQSELYGTASRLRFEADAATTLGSQRLAADAGIFTAWLEAHEAGDVELETLLSKRLTPDFKVAFDAWLQTDPFVNESAPPGPAAMAEYKNPDSVKAAALNARASAALRGGDQGAGDGREVCAEHGAVRGRVVSRGDRPAHEGQEPPGRRERHGRDSGHLRHRLDCRSAATVRLGRFSSP